MRLLLYSFFFPYLLYSAGFLGGGCSKSNATYKTQYSNATVGELMGVNAFVDDPVERLSPFSIVREYHNWAWDEGDLQFGDQRTYSAYPHNKMQFAPSAAGGGYWNFDQFYTSLSHHNIKVAPCIQGSVAWLHGNNYFRFDNKPVDESGMKADNPLSYHKKAFHSFQFAARYGSKQIADSLLALASGQPRTSGLGLVKYVEDWNEPDKFWMNESANFSPSEYAAMLSANYDGHCNSLHASGKKFGVKSADPDMKVVMSGLTSIDLPYLNAMMDWFNKNRADKKFAADVINVHQYCWRTSNGPQGGGPAISPEAFGLKEKMQQVVDFRNKNAPDAEVWLSEFGWDTHPSSPLAAPLIGSFSRLEVQAMWLVRAYLALMAAGVDKGMVYMLRDVDETSPIQFATCGLTTKKGSWDKKPSWFYLSTFKKLLGDMQFIGEENNDDSDLITYKFKRPQSNEGAYVIWYKTSNDKRNNSYKLPLNERVSDARTVEFSNTDDSGKSSAVSITAPIVSVSEKPIFVIVDFIE